MKNPFSKIVDSATAVLGVGRDIIDTLFTNDEERAEAKRKLAAALQEGQLKQAELRLDELKANASDRADARTMYRRTRSWVVPTLAMAFTLGFFAVIFWVLFYGVPDGQSQVTWMLVGTLQTATITILTFFFGRTDSDDQRAAHMPVDGPQSAPQNASQGGSSRKGGGLPTLRNPTKGLVRPTKLKAAPLADTDTPKK